MRKMTYITTVTLLLMLAGCIPTQANMVETRAVILPTFSATSTPANTATPAPTTSAPDEPPTAAEGADLDLEARSAVLMNATTGEILFEKNVHQQMYPASTTKIMTALLALDYFKTDEIIRVGDEANLTWAADRSEAQKAGLFYGQELTMKELLYGLLLPSGSDAAFSIAVNVARRASEDDYLPDHQALTYFAALMNQKAVSLGAEQTNFTNPDGIQDPNHYSTAYDLALIAQAAMQDPQIREIVATPVYQTAQTVNSPGEAFSRSWENTNRLIQPEDEHYYPPANGIKTGTTEEAGHCLVSSAMLGSDLLIAVVL
ncbi:MAG TPA: D-alanyl-D-alanine carboxypeptidase, partial [Anaerolineaceae bacterium]|nr:D-alanyl-D-alanine carboxypeptidase [Anaerolineaceae bacterium]